jgi:hypothetical protein
MERGAHVVLVSCVILVAVALPRFALAQEAPFEITVCRAGTLNFLQQSKEATVLSVDVAGIVSASTDKRFENMTSRCLGVGGAVNGKRFGNGFCKYLDPDGDVVIVAYTSSADKAGEGTWQFIHGTNKWAGIKGDGTFKFFTRGKPIAAGTGQSCNRVTGKFALVK